MKYSLKMTKLTESIKVSKALKKYLLDRGTKSDSFEQIIWRLIGHKKISKEDKSQTPSDYEKKVNEKKKLKEQ